MGDPHPDANFTTWRSCLSRSAIALIVLVTLARLAYLAFLCPYDLIEDEAQYWVWSLRPDWSYYSKGPGIAWSIWLSTHALGTSEWGVRALVPIYAAVAALCIAGLAADAGRDRRAALTGAAVFYLIPLFALTATFVMTIAGPMVACWAIASWSAFRALYRSSRSAWIVLGLALAAGILFKYTVLLLIPGLIAIAILDRKSLRVAPRSAPLAAGACLITLLGLVPIAIWNMHNDWPALRHLLGHAKLPGGDQLKAAPGYSPLWTLEFIGIQLAAVGPALALMWFGARRMLAGDHESRSGARFLLWCGLPTIIFYLLATFLTNVEGNWAMGGFVTLAALAAVGAVRGMDEFRALLADWLAIKPAQRPRAGFVRRKPETLPQVAWHFTVGYGIIASLLMLRLDWIASLPLIGPNVALHRLKGVRQYAQAVDRLHRERVPDGPIISYHYGVAAQLTFYLPDHPMVYVAGSRLGYRRTQWDLWPDMDLSQPRFAGASALLIGASLPQWESCFGKVVEIGRLREDPRRDRWTWIGEGFNGFKGFGKAVQ